jgi:hypothetical protein
MLSLTKRQNPTGRVGSRGEAGGLTPAGQPFGGGRMSDNLDHDVRALKQWLRGAWRFLADPSSTRFERREVRNYMRQADVALRAGLKSAASRQRSRRDAERVLAARPRPDFRVIKLDA